MKYFNHFLSGFVNRVKERKGFLLVCLALMPLTTCFGVQTKGFSSEKIALSLADGFIAAGSGYLFYCNLVMLPVFLLSLLTLRDFSVPYLLCSGAPGRLWLREVYSALLVSASFAVYQVVLVFLLVGPKCGALINFDQRQSLFAYATNGRTLSGLQFWQLLFPAFAFLLLTAFLYTLLFLLLKWIFFKPRWPVLILISLAFLDITNQFGICTFFGIYYDKWLAYNPICLLAPVALSAAFMILGHAFSGRKEFLRAR